jgi:hypothetical protein
MMAGLYPLPLAQVEQDPDIRTIQVKQENEFDLSFRGVYQYKFSVASNVLALRGFVVTDRYLFRSNTKGVVWRTEFEEMLLIDVVGDESITVALEFTQKHDDYDYDSRGMHSQRRKFIVVFNIFATRARLGIIIPDSSTYETMKTLLGRHVKPGDWMTHATQNSSLFYPRTLARGVKINVQLVRNRYDLGLQSYEAEISFEGAVEPPMDSRIELPHDEITAELLNNDVTRFIRRGLRNPMSVDPAANHYIRSFLIHKEWEKERDLGLRGVAAEEMELNDQSSMSSNHVSWLSCESF